MMRLNNRKKGMALMFCLYFIIILAGLSFAAFIRDMSESRTCLREKDRIVAFYNAEASLAYAYAGLAKQNFNWYTIPLPEYHGPRRGQTAVQDVAHPMRGENLGDYVHARGGSS